MKTAVVTGAGRGLGREIAKGLATKGFSVLATDLDEDSAAETARIIGPSAWSMRQDVRDAAFHHEVTHAANQRGALELWVNNAGVLYAGSAWEHSDEEVGRMVDINVLGMIWGARAAVEAMRAKGGHIINIASISALTPAPGLAIYGATKHAVLGFTYSLAGDIQRAGLPIEVSAVCPHGINTDMVRDISDSKDVNLVFTQPKLLSVEEVAATVLDLVDKPRLAVTMPRAFAALVHALRPFPGLSLKLDKPMSWLGDLQRRKGRGSD